jgi:hypothetical protein
MAINAAGGLHVCLWLQLRLCIHVSRSNDLIDRFYDENTTRSDTIGWLVGSVNVWET